MQVLYIKLIGYIGIYNGLGKDTLEIDLTKANNKICVICGPNGVGKSTLQNAIGILPESNDQFVPTMNAQKIITFTDGQNVYTVTFNHPLDKNNKRGVTKVSFMKNGLELNPNGNVSSYKDTISAEFDMDINYITLSKIGGDRRGLADKTPAERKKILSSVNSSLDVYNGIYKIINKKANNYHSQLSALSTKINNIGNEDNLRSALKGIESHLLALSTSIEQTKTNIIQLDTVIHMTDHDGKIQERYDTLNRSIIDLKKELESDYRLAYQLQLKCKIDDSHLIQVKEIEKLLSNSNIILDSYKESDITLQASVNEGFRNLSTYQDQSDKLKIKIDSITIKEDIKPALDNCELQIEKIKQDFELIQVEDIDHISKEEIDLLINFLTDLIIRIDDLYEESSPEIVSSLVNSYRSNITPEVLLNKNKLDLSQLESSLSLATDSYNTCISDLQTIDQLSIRPKTCKDDTCPYISQMVKVLNKYQEIQNLNLQISTLESQIEELNQNILMKKDMIQNNENILLISAKLRTIMDAINSYHAILSKFRLSIGVLEENTFLDHISNGYRFNEIRDMQVYLNLSNDIIQYQQLNEMKKKKKKDYGIQLNNTEVKNQYQKELESIEDKIVTTKAEIASNNKEYNFNKQILKSEEDKQRSLDLLKDKVDAYQEKHKSLLEMQAELDKMKQQSKSNLDSMAKISDLKISLQDLLNQKEPLEAQKKIIDTQLTMLKSYQEEYQKYNDRYIYMDKLKKYSSPTQDGIQNLFMSFYMDKTLDMVNQLLRMIFNGQYQILKYKIDEGEFKIPFVGNGLPVDDISNGSTSQVCIMGMLINLVLYTMSSSRYNIVTLDEIDGGLDQNNRYLFVDILQKISSILQIDQLFIISHSVESALNNVDVILLSNDSEYTD